MMRSLARWFAFGLLALVAAALLAEGLVLVFFGEQDRLPTRLVESNLGLLPCFMGIGRGARSLFTRGSRG